ncbi:MAG: cation:dicarboxylase symporter family transporter [Spirochaetaceae bacterium]|jgi:Na+/H+-dicarboxylate symporter|nr:cation:dicarboxylase symporter family transporter [Spirochaetaceae bacterium]
MKIWVKFLFASILGVVLGFLLPADNTGLMSWLSWLAGLAVRIGRYTAPAVMLFSLTIALYELRLDKAFWGVFFRSLFLVLAVSLVVITLGQLAVILFPPERIPIMIEEQQAAPVIEMRSLIDQLIPSNMFTALTGAGVYLLPLYVFVFVFAIGLSYDKTHTKSIIDIIDSLSRIFYHIIAFISEVISPALIVLAAYWAVRYREVLSSGVYKSLLGFLGIFSLILCFVIFPAFLCLFRQRQNQSVLWPWKEAYASLGPAFAAFFSGDMNFTLPLLLRNNGENLGVKRRINAPVIAFFSTFCRVGSAVVAAISFIVVIRSYSSLGITTAEVFEIALQTLALSFLLAGCPGDAAWTALAVIGVGYGRGFEAGYLILKPVAFYLIAIGTFIDVMICGYASFAIARMKGLQDDKPIRTFI